MYKYIHYIRLLVEMFSISLYSLNYNSLVIFEFYKQLNMSVGCRLKEVGTYGFPNLRRFKTSVTDGLSCIRRLLLTLGYVSSIFGKLGAVGSIIFAHCPCPYKTVLANRRDFSWRLSHQWTFKSWSGTELSTLICRFPPMSTTFPLSYATSWLYVSLNQNYFQKSRATSVIDEITLVSQNDNGGIN